MLSVLVLRLGHGFCAVEERPIPLSWKFAWSHLTVALILLCPLNFEIKLKCGHLRARGLTETNQFKDTRIHACILQDAIKWAIMHLYRASKHREMKASRKPLIIPILTNSDVEYCWCTSTTIQYSLTCHIREFCHQLVRNANCSMKLSFISLNGIRENSIKWIFLLNFEKITWLPRGFVK